MKLISDSSVFIQSVKKTKTELKGLPLSPREQQVWAMVAQGLRNKEIAKGMNVQEGTVKQHLYVAMAKMDCRTRTELALKYSTMYAGKH